jgi:8-oxo-(d)GTP phosphatase
MILPPELGDAARSDYGADAGGQRHPREGTAPPLHAVPPAGRPAKGGKVAVRAAGAVVWRPGLGGPEVALIHRPRYGDWSFPKGKLDPGEGYVAAAVREVFEETGFPVLLGRRLPTQLYEVSMGGPAKLKRVKYWAAQAAADIEFQPNEEVDRLEWLSIPQALRRLTRATDADLLEAFAALPVDTAPIMLLRHASALARKHWRGADPDRPLTATGQEEAQALVPLLGTYGDSSLVTSDALRCIETLEPYAKDIGTELVRVSALSEETRAAHPRAAAKWLRGTVKAGRPVIACTHRPVVPGMLAESAAGVAAQAGRRALAPAEAWVLHTRDGSVVAIDRLKGARRS